jgi:hypothetical protein
MASLPPLNETGVMLATSSLQLQLYRVLGEHLDRQTAYQIVICALQEYQRGATRATKTPALATEGA